MCALGKPTWLKIEVNCRANNGNTASLLINEQKKNYLNVSCQKAN